MANKEESICLAYIFSSGFLKIIFQPSLPSTFIFAANPKTALAPVFCKRRETRVMVNASLPKKGANSPPLSGGT